MILMQIISDETFAEQYLLPGLVLFAVTMGLIILISIFYGLKEGGAFNLVNIRRNYFNLLAGSQDIAQSTIAYTGKAYKKARVYLADHYRRFQKSNDKPDADQG